MKNGNSNDLEGQYACCFAKDAAEIPADNALVVYRERELRQLVGKTPEQLQKIHWTKTTLEGEVIQ